MAMDFSALFLDILKSVDYHHDHLPRDLFANEERLQELVPVFAWLTENVSPTTNCVTPKELALYTSISSKHGNISSLEEVSEAIEKFYDESTKDTTVSAADLDALERNIAKSEQELHYLKAQGTMYEKKLQMVDDDISSLKKTYKSVNTRCYQMENGLKSVLKKFTEGVNEFDSNVNKLHDRIVDSLKNDDFYLPKLLSNNLLRLNESRRQQIYKMIELWFNKGNMSAESDISPNIFKLSLIFESVTKMAKSEINANCNVLELNLAVENLFNVKHYCNQLKESPNGLDVSDYLEKFMKNQKVHILNNQQFDSSEYDEIKSGIRDMLVSDAEKKLTKAETMNKRLTFLLDSTEHYNIINNVLHCLMRVNCSIINTRCEIVSHCVNLLEKTVDDILFSQQCISNQTVVDGGQQCQNVKKTERPSTLGIVAKFTGNVNLTTDPKEIEELSKMVKLWRSKYHFSREECIKLTSVQQKLHAYYNTISNLPAKHSDNI